MDSKLLFVLAFALMAGIALAAKSDEYSDDEESREIERDETEETSKKDEVSNDEQPKMIMEDMNTETSMALTEDDDPDSIKNKGLCHYGIAAWFKPGKSIQCNCLKCTCKTGGNWACAYNFAYCPYFYCGNQIYNPSSQVCCCGKVHNKKGRHACCGYFYHDTRHSKCCNYYSVKPKKARCPRYRV